MSRNRIVNIFRISVLAGSLALVGVACDDAGVAPVDDPGMEDPGAPADDPLEGGDDATSP